MRELMLSLVASVIVGGAVWLGERLRQHRRLARKRDFFGVSQATPCALVSPRHWSSPKAASVHRRDVAALVELATIVNDCGGRADVVTEETGLHGIGRVTEFCVGGPTANSRTDVHLRAVLPGVRFELGETGIAELPISVGSTVYRSSREADYAVLAKAYIPETPHPVFILAGQRSWTNLAAARLLASRYRSLRRTYGATGRFCLVLKIIESASYGPDFVEIVADATDEAFRTDHNSARTISS